jgi:hypothetical protein
MTYMLADYANHYIPSLIALLSDMHLSRLLLVRTLEIIESLLYFSVSGTSWEEFFYMHGQYPDRSEERMNILHLAISEYVS